MDYEMDMEPTGPQVTVREVRYLQDINISIFSMKGFTDKYTRRNPTASISD